MRAITCRAFFYPLVACALLVGACATTDEQKPSAPAPVTGTKPGATASPTPVPQQPVTKVETGKPGATSPFAALKDPNNILSRRSVYFDYDKFDVKDDYRKLVEAHAKFLKDNPSAKMLSRAMPTTAAAANTTSASASAAPTP